MRDSSKPSANPPHSGPLPGLAAVSSDQVAVDDGPVFDTDRSILTPKEIETLLRPVRRKAKNSDNKPQAAPRSEPLNKDGVSPDRDTAFRLNAGLGVRISKALRGEALDLTVTPRESADFDAASLGQLMSGTPVIIAGFGRSASSLSTLVCLPLGLANVLISQMRTTQRVADNTDLSRQPNALDFVFLHKIIATLNSIFGDGVRLQAITTDLGDVADLFQTENITITEYDVTGDSLASDLALIEGRACAPPQAEAEKRKPDLAEVPIIAMLTARLSGFEAKLGDLKDLSVGSTLMLGLAADRPVEILSGGRDGAVISQADIGRRGNKMALKVKFE
ncbi:MAG: FliM/FliN family flagellar motor C-terminal domain-containing protein [Henriciella sp.]